MSREARGGARLARLILGRNRGQSFLELGEDREPDRLAVTHSPRLDHALAEFPLRRCGRGRSSRERDHRNPRPRGTRAARSGSRPSPRRRTRSSAAFPLRRGRCRARRRGPAASSARSPLRAAAAATPSPLWRVAPRRPFLISSTSDSATAEAYSAAAMVGRRGRGAPRQLSDRPAGRGRSRDRRGPGPRARAPAAHAGDDRLGELRPPGGARRGRLGADQQVRRGPARASATTAAARRSTSPSSSRSTAPRSCSGPSTPTSSPTRAPRPTTPPTWRWRARATRSWAWRSTTAAT